jgi:hypothetical protein
MINEDVGSDGVTFKCHFYKVSTNDLFSLIIIIIIYIMSNLII